MALKSGRITKIGSVSGAQPQGRIWLLQNEGAGNETEDQINVDTTAGSARWDTAMQAFMASKQVEVDTLNSNNPFVADKIRMT